MFFRKDVNNSIPRCCEQHNIQLTFIVLGRIRGHRCFVCSRHKEGEMQRNLQKVETTKRAAGQDLYLRPDGSLSNKPGFKELDVPALKGDMF